MRLYNKGGRAFIIDRKDAINGCRLPSDEIGKLRAYIDPNTDVEVEDAVGEKLLRNYPTELKKMGNAELKKKLKVKKTKKSKVKIVK